jgi:hypothetical protein
MDPSFGARLRLQRERHQTALTDVAERTKIKLALLEGLERDDLSHWPAGIFRRSYVRAYAQAIGLEPDTVVREFLELYPDPIEETPEAIAAARVLGGEWTRSRPPTRLQFLIGSALGAIPALRPNSAYGRWLAAEPLAGIAPASSDGIPFRTTDEPSLLAASATAIAGNVTSVEVDHHPGSRDLFKGAQRNGSATESDVSRSHRSPLDLMDAAELCSRLARAAEPENVVAVLEDAARILDAVGLIVWIWDQQRSALRHVLSLGYADEVLAQLPDVQREADNAIAAAFRSTETRVVNGNGAETGAVVIPLPTPTGCSGVLALELRDGGERREHVRAFASIVAAQLSCLIGHPSAVHERAPRERNAPCVDHDLFAREP